MLKTSITSITISSLKRPFSFDGQFTIFKISDLLSVFSDGHAFKSKFYTLLIIDKGEGKMMMDNEIFEIKKGRTFFINYNQVFHFSELKNFSGQVLLFTRSFYNLIYTGNMKIKNDTAFSSLASFVDFEESERKDFLQCVKKINHEFDNNNVLSKEIICLLLKVIMLKYIRSSGNANYIDFKTNRKVTYLEDFKKLVDAHFKELKRTSDYASKLNISPNYLNAVVKDKLDISAETFIQNRVILEAERLLLNTDFSVTEISFELGFSDKSHFGKYFKKVANDSPNNYRKKFLQEAENED
ncbi:AraC family transcriptional regulator [Candidatus Kaistella beijingensis]|uniref:AraC family transcriptional regulator n=1 Tax=Candidatus Kaistella beijingensis TaxID=2820270 RepID=UPI001CC59988|nr:helix-turn-helix domain-containing protein [Candidatus Kaistella beijingensis]UBB90387.1 AraC family transcriptional regulator [Candidatus Kaistella beijingensis]